MTGSSSIRIAVAASYFCLRAALSVEARASFSSLSTSGLQYFVSLMPPLQVTNWWMLPSGIDTARPVGARRSDICRPSARPAAWRILCAFKADVETGFRHHRLHHLRHLQDTGIVGDAESRACMRSTPASFISALAFSTSRAGQGCPCCTMGCSAGRAGCRAGRCLHRRSA